MHCPWGQHIWIDRPSSQRHGWIATYCQRCRKFLGRRPEEYGWAQPKQRGPGGTWADEDHSSRQPAHHQTKPEDRRKTTRSHGEDLLLQPVRQEGEDQRPVRGGVQPGLSTGLWGQSLDRNRKRRGGG